MSSPHPDPWAMPGMSEPLGEDANWMGGANLPDWLLARAFKQGEMDAFSSGSDGSTPQCEGSDE